MDKYITNENTLTYGPRLSGSLRRMFPEAGPVQTFAVWVAEQLDAATQTLGQAMGAHRSTASVRSANA